MKLSTKEIVLLIVMIFLISGAVYYYYFLTPKLAELETLEIASTQKEQQIQQMNLKISGIETKRQEIQALQQQLVTSEEDLPYGISHELQLVNISQTVRNYVQMPSFIFNPGSDTRTNYQINLVEVAFDSTYPDLLQVLEDFSKSTHKNQIVAASVTYAGNSTDYYTLPEEAEEEDYTDISVSMVMEFFTYYSEGEDVPLEEQEFETSPVEEKSPFSPIIR